MFQVKDVAALRCALAGWPFLVEERPELGRSGVCIYADDEDGSGHWSDWQVADEESGTETELWVPGMIGKHLVEGQVAVFVHAGAEARRYVQGYAVASDWRGRLVRVDLESVYGRAARRFGVDPVSIRRAVF